MAIRFSSVDSIVTGPMYAADIVGAREDYTATGFSAITSAWKRSSICRRHLPADVARLM